MDAGLFATRVALTETASWHMRRIPPAARDRDCWLRALAAAADEMYRYEVEPYMRALVDDMATRLPVWLEALDDGASPASRQFEQTVRDLIARTAARISAALETVPGWQVIV